MFQTFPDSDLKTAKKIIENYEIDYPTDSMQFDSSCVRQLQDAQDIVTVYKRLTDRWKNVESLQEDIKVCILSGVKLQEKEVDEKIEKVETSLNEYANKYTEFKKDKRETLNRIQDYIEKMEIANNSQSNSNHPLNNTAKTKYNSDKKYICKNQKFNSSNKSRFKDIIEEDSEEADETEDETEEESDESDVSEDETEEESDDDDEQDLRNKKHIQISRSIKCQKLRHALNRQIKKHN